MNRRSFAQAVGGAAVFRASAKNTAPAEAAESARPGKIMAIAAHPGDGLFTMGAVLAQQIDRGGTAVLLSLSLGERGAPKDVPVQQYGEMKRNATEKAAHLLRAEAVFLLLHAGKARCLRIPIARNQQFGLSFPSNLSGDAISLRS